MALALVVAATAARLVLTGFVHDVLPFATFFAAVVIASLLGGVVGGAATLIASLLVALWSSISPQGAHMLPGVEPAKSALFVIASLVFIGCAAGLRRLQHLRTNAESRLERILDATAVAIIERNAEGEVTYANPAAIRMLQLKEKAGLWVSPGWKIRERNGEPETPDGSPFARILRGEPVAPTEATFTHPETGELLVLTGSSAPIHDRKGRLVGATTSLIDITAQRRIETALAQRDIEYRVLAESSPQLSWSTDAEGQADYFSPQWIDYTGVPAAAQFGRGWLDVLHPDDLAATQLAWVSAVEGAASYDLEYRIRRHDGEYRWFKTRGLPVRDEAGKVTRWFGSSTDIDDIVKARNLLASRVAQQDREQARIFELSDDLFGAGNLEGRLWLINPAWVRLLGVDEATVLSQPIGHWMHPDDRPSLDRLPQVLMSSATVRRLESRLRTAAGEYRWIAWNAIVEGDVIYTVGRDVTEAKAAEQALREANARLTSEMDERRKAESALAQAQRLEAIGQLTGGIAHDFNNLLQVISGGLELMRTAGETRRERLMDAIGKAAVRGGELTRQLLSFARRQPLQPQVIDLAAQVIAMRDLLDRSLRGDVRVVTDFEPELWPVEVDPAQLELAVLNIAVNARDALPGEASSPSAGGTVRPERSLRIRWRWPSPTPARACRRKC
ncbi:MAG: PAS domain S-box protein [Caulobacteraceae bacterium]